MDSHLEDSEETDRYVCEGFGDSDEYEDDLADQVEKDLESDVTADGEHAVDFDEEFSADIEQMKAMGLPLSFTKSSHSKTKKVLKFIGNCLQLAHCPS